MAKSKKAAPAKKAKSAPKSTVKVSKSSKRPWEPTLTLVLGIASLLTIFSVEETMLYGVAVGIATFIVGIPALKYENRGRAVAGMIAAGAALLMGAAVWVAILVYNG